MPIDPHPYKRILPEQKTISFKTKVVETLTPDQISIIKDLKRLQSIDEEADKIYHKLKPTGLSCKAQSNEFSFYPIVVLDWILKNGYTPEVKLDYDKMEKELGEKK